MSPNFQKNLSIPVRNHLTNGVYILKRIDEVELTGDRKKEITSICNEPHVYSWIFQEILENATYTEEKSGAFFEMGCDGWHQNEKFIFLLLSPKGEVAAAIDIKSRELGNAEIGYWASKSHRGCMTNTTTELLRLARAAGYQSLFGRTKKGNKDSVGVLLRAGFKIDSEESEKDKIYDFYRIRLQENINENKSSEATACSRASS